MILYLALVSTNLSGAVQNGAKNPMALCPVTLKSVFEGHINVADFP